MTIEEIRARLTPRQYEAVSLRACGMSLREVGELMGISAPAVYYLIRRARKQLKKQWKNERLYLRAG